MAQETQMESEKEKQEMIVQFNRTDAIPDAPRYELTTVAEIMAVLTPENVDRFLVDWVTGIKGMVLTVDLVKQIALDTDGTVLTPEMIGVDKFTWIDDAPRTTNPA